MYYSMSFVPCSDHTSWTSPTGFLDSLRYARNTWDDWHIVPTSRPSIAPPRLKEHYVDVAGASGKIDLSQALSGYPLYDNRIGSLEFAVLNDYRNWQIAYTDIMTTLNGKKMFMVYEEDPEYFYIGRWHVKSWITGKNRSTLTLEYDLEPYKRKLHTFRENWLWDPFNFRNGIIPSRTDMLMKTMTVNDDNTFVQMFNTGVLLESHDDAVNDQENVSNVIGNAPIPLTLSVAPTDQDAQITIRFQSQEDERQVLKTYTRDRWPAVGMSEDPDFLITNWVGSNNISIDVKGRGTVSIDFRAGRM